MTTTFFTLLDQQYGTREEAISAEQFLIEQGYPLEGEYIRQYWIDNSGGVVSQMPKTYPNR